MVFLPPLWRTMMRPGAHQRAQELGPVLSQMNTVCTHVYTHTQARVTALTTKCCQHVMYVVRENV